MVVVRAVSNLRAERIEGPRLPSADENDILIDEDRIRAFGSSNTRKCHDVSLSKKSSKNCYLCTRFVCIQSIVNLLIQMKSPTISEYIPKEARNSAVHGKAIPFE